MHLRGLLLTSAFLATWACRASAAPAPPFELSRYLGDWYVIAQAPGLEPGGPAHLEYRAQGRAVEERRFAVPAAGARDADPLAPRHWTADPDDAAHWTENSWWPFGARRSVLYVSPDYRQSLVQGPDGLQMLARERQVPEWVYAGLLARLAGLGYDPGGLRRVDFGPDAPAAGQGVGPERRGSH